VTGLDTIGIPVVMVCRPNARSLSASQGKGADLAAAQASGLMESIELFHAEHIALPLLWLSYEDIRYRYRVADPAQLPRAANGHMHPHLPIHWIEGYDLMGHESVWLPYELVHTNYTMAMHRNMAGFLATSNGLASGNHLLEAISHAICEVVERDATTLWRLLPDAARARTRIDLSTVTDPACREVLERYRRAEIAVFAWEITSDVGIPAFMCRIFDQHSNPMRVLGMSECMGCHPVREVALLRALTEAAQSRLTYIAGSRDDCFPVLYQQLRDPEAIRRHQADLGEGHLLRHFDDGSSWRSDTFTADVQWELERLKAVGITQVIAVDLTKPEFGLPVVRVVIPGLEASSEQSNYVPGARALARMEQSR